MRQSPDLWLLALTFDGFEFPASRVVSQKATTLGDCAPPPFI